MRQNKFGGRRKFLPNSVNQTVGLYPSSSVARLNSLIQVLESWSNLFPWTTRQVCILSRRPPRPVMDAWEEQGMMNFVIII